MCALRCGEGPTVSRRALIQLISRPVSRVLYGSLKANVTAIHLGRRLRGASSNQPERLIRTDLARSPRQSLDCGPRHSYSVLLPVGFAMPSALPPTRCALTAPFHPYPS